MYINYNDNPGNLDVGDCVVRAISLALSYNWFMVHDELSFLSRKMFDMASSNRVWKTYLKEKGYIEQQAMRDARSEAEREEIRQIMARYPR